MSIQITITIDPNQGFTLQQILEDAGLVRPRYQGPFTGAGTTEPLLGNRHADLMPTTAESQTAPFTSFEKSLITAVSEATAHAENETPAPGGFPPFNVSNVVDQPKRGRPRKNPEAETKAPVAEVVPAVSNVVEYTVRRYDGQTDLDTVDSGVATARLVELIHNAGERGALQALMMANRGLVESLHTERREDISGAVYAMDDNFDAEDRKAAAGKPAPEPEAPALPVYYKQDGTVLTAITADKAGAQSAILAIAGGAVPKLGFIAAKALLAEFGVEKVSALPDGDERLAQLATQGATLLGLPMAA